MTFIELDHFEKFLFSIDIPYSIKNDFFKLTNDFTFMMKSREDKNNTRQHKFFFVVNIMFS